MVGERMVGSWSEVKWGTRSGKGGGVHGCSWPEEPRSEGVRVLGGAKKSRNGDGSQGGQEGGSVKETSRQETPLAVVGREPEAPQDAEIRARWAWVEASVWTTRMLPGLSL